MSVVFRVELERETGGAGSPRWSSCPACSPAARAKMTPSPTCRPSLRVVADRLENEEAGREYLSIPRCVIPLITTPKRIRPEVLHE